MPPPPKITAAKRAEVERLARAGTPRNEIHRKTGVSLGSVTNICKAAGISFDRQATKAATEARMADLKDRRTRIREKYLARAEEQLDKLDQPYLVFNFGARDNVYAEKSLQLPPAADIKHLMSAATLATNAELRIGAADSDTQGLSAVDEWISAMSGGGVDEGEPADGESA